MSEQVEAQGAPVEEFDPALGPVEVEDTGVVHEITDTDHINARMLKSLQTGVLPIESSNPDPSDDDPDGEWA